MCILRYRPSSVPSASMTSAVLWYTPAVAALEDGADDDDAELARELGEALGGGTGNRLGEVERSAVFLAAEILRAEEFLDADDLRAPSGGFADAPFGFGQILVGIDRAGHLNEAHAKFRMLHNTIVTGGIGAAAICRVRYEVRGAGGRSMPGAFAR